MVEVDPVMLVAMAAAFVVAVMFLMPQKIKAPEKVRLG